MMSASEWLPLRPAGFHGKIASLGRLLRTKTGLGLHHDEGHNINRVIASEHSLLSE